MLQNHLLPFIIEDHSDGYVVMQDGAPCHKINVKKVWFQHHNVEALEWPPCSHDLNLIATLWCIIVSRVYRYEKLYEIKEQIINEILEQWATIKQQTLVNLPRSLPNRIAKVLQVRGKQK